MKVNLTSLSYLSSLPDDFLGAASLSHLSAAAHLDSHLNKPGLSLGGTGASALRPVLTPGDECDATLSVSSESISLPTQVEAQPAAPTVELAEKLTEASLDEVADESPKEQREEKSELPVVVEVTTRPEVTVHSVPQRLSVTTSKAEATKEEGPQDLRVFELSSDSGKSTPSNNGKKGIKTFQVSDFKPKNGRIVHITESV